MSQHNSFLVKILLFLFLPLISILAMVPSSEGADCDCRVYEKVLEEAERIFRDLEKSGEERETLFLKCRDSVDSSGILAGYCANTFLGENTDLLRNHRRERDRLEGLQKACRDAGGNCREWKKKESGACADLKGEEQARCYAGMGIWEEFEALFSEIAKEFEKAREEEQRNIKNYLHAKKAICDEKYKKDESRRERCVANFRNKYQIQALLDSFARGEKGEEPEKKSEEKSTATEGSDEVAKDSKADSEKQEPDADLLGRWLCEENGFIFEIAKKGSALSLECLAGCGSGEEYKWEKEYRFTRKYTKSNKLGTGSFDEICSFDDAKEEFTCRGTVNFISTKYGASDVSKLESRHCFKMME